MKKVQFGRTGFAVSQLGFGAAPIGYLNTEREKAGKILNLLLDRGVNVIDTAASYEASEEVIAEAIGHRRKEFVLISKCGGTLADIDAPAWSAELIRKTVDRSLRRLKTERLDVMLLHSCDLQTLERGEALGALVEAQKAGKVRWPGYSGDNEAVAWAAGRSEVAVIETSINIVDQVNIDLVLGVTRAKNCGVLAKRPIANAAWKPLSSQPGLYQGYAKTYTDRFARMGLRIEELGFKGKAEEVWPEIALRFTLSIEGVHSAIIGTTNPVNAEKNIGYAEKGPLAGEVVAKIRYAFERAQASAGGGWSGQT
ncbi:MAG TPA: aldo/keto reductase [Tepidisphaeraceae bacterium]|jgi:aryl-alcohol dehydrogenase-like predicted oxidoreductase|nr:aldo/keto reductase [Tepidisphaeraceae bacterium]